MATMKTLTIGGKTYEIADDQARKAVETVANQFITAGYKYVTGTPIKFTLTADGWNGTNYNLNTFGYVIGKYGVQIGIPDSYSAVNTEALIKAAITIRTAWNYTSGTEAGTYAILELVAITKPTQDIDIVLFGLEDSV